MNPLVDYTRTLLKHGPAPRYYPRVILYFFKLAVWEPFRYAEKLAQWVRPEPVSALSRPPVFILGYYRSGTTHLQETMLQDPEFAYMNFYQGFFPTAFSSTEAWLKPIFEWIMSRSGYLHPAHQVPFSFTLPAEEDVSMVASAFRLAANWGQVLPRSFKHFYRKTAFMEGISESERAEFKRELHRLIWRVSKAEGHKRLLLKSPPHTGRLATLLEMYPDAKFIFIRRNPYDVFASNKTLWRSFSETWLEDVDELTIRDYILWAHDKTHANYERDKTLLGPGQLCEVAFEDFVEAPLDTLRQIYTTLSLGDFEALRPHFADYLGRTHDRPRTRYFLSRDERVAIEARLSRWLDAWGYKPPRSRGVA